jgi:hypothetical protein
MGLVIILLLISSPSTKASQLIYEGNRTKAGGETASVLRNMSRHNAVFGSVNVDIYRCVYSIFISTDLILRFTISLLKSVLLSINISPITKKIISHKYNIYIKSRI